MSLGDTFKIIGFVVFCLAIVYYFGQCMKLHTTIIEGLENKPDAVAPKTDGGVGANAAQFAENIKAMAVKMQDELLIDKYKSDYEKIILETDTLLDMFMLKTVLSIKPDPQNPKSTMDALQSITLLKNSKDALNDVMKFIDKQ